MIFSKVSVSRLQLLPETGIGGVAVTLHIAVGHAEWIDADADILLAVTQRGIHIRKNLIHIGVSHGIAANRLTVAMNHQVIAAVALITIVLIWKADVDRAIKPAIRLQLIQLHVVKTFRAFEIAFTAFRAKAARKVTDAVGVQQAVFVTDFAVEFERAFFLEDLDIDRGAE